MNVPTEGNARTDTSTRPGNLGSDRNRERLSIINTDRIGTIIQGSAILIALSVIFGRIFVLARDKALGIPTPLTQLDTIDYAVVSPDVTVMNVGLSIFLIFNWIWRPPRFNFWRWDITSYGIVLIGLSVAARFIDEPTADSLFDNPGAWGLLNLFQIVGILYGIGLLFQSIPWRIVQRYALGPTETKAEESRNQLRSFYPIIVGMYVVPMFLMALIFVWEEGERDANNLLRDAHLAVVIHNTESLEDSDLGSIEDDCIALQFGHVYKVVSIDDDFIHVLPSGVEIQEDNLVLLALRITEIKAIRYIAHDKLECLSAPDPDGTQIDAH